MINDFGKSQVTVKKTDLLDAMRKNREAHRETFLKAQGGYREAVVRELDAMLREAREGGHIRRAVQLVEPEDHTRDYNRVVRMLEMSTADEIVISEQQFSQYVLDEWGWSASFRQTSASYGAA